MKILASALMDAARTYLHAGYISAYPRTLWPGQVYEGGPDVLSVQLDMVEALRLQGEAAAAAVTSDGGTQVAAALSSGSASMFGAAVAATAGAAGLALLHRRLGLRPGMAVAAGALLGLLTAGQLSCGDSESQAAYEKSLPAPWEEVELRAYADPGAATQAILHGIIADGITGVDFPVEELRHIQLEVGLPTSSPTEGMAYALSTYGYDGWGREFRLTQEDDQYENHYYTVTSAGPDGSFDNEDDIALTLGEAANDTWDSWRWATFLRRDSDGSLVSLFHRFRGDHFEYNHEDEAQAVTGGELFDLFDEGDLETWLEDLEAQYDAAAADVGHDPILLQVYRNY